MPKKTNRSTTPRARSNSPRGKDDASARLQASGAHEQTTPRVIANSVFALTLRSKPWTELAEDLQTDESLEKLALTYRDLLAGYNRSIHLTSKPLFTPTIGLSPAAGVRELLEHFKENFLPDGFDFDINEHQQHSKGRQEYYTGYHIVMHKACDFAYTWHFFDLKPVVEQLKGNPRLHDFFIVFMRSFCEKCRIPVWWGTPFCEGGCLEKIQAINEALQKGHYKEGKKNLLVEILTDGSDEISEEDYLSTREELETELTELENAVADHNYGVAKHYENLLIEAKSRTPDSLLKSLTQFPSQSHLVKFMRAACELMKSKATLDDFDYSGEYRTWGEGLAVRDQVTLIWDWHDKFSEEVRDSMNAIAQDSGALAPVLHARLLPDLKSFYLEDFIKAQSWPKQFSKVWEMYLRVSQKGSNYYDE